MSGQGLATSTGVTVGRLQVRFIGVANVSDEVVRANMQVREGGPFDEAALDRDIRSLYRTGLFEFIEIKREEISPTVINLVVEVTSKYRVLSIEFDGNKHASNRRLRKEVTSKPNAALDERNIKKDAEKIFEYYQKRGYSQAEVNYTIDRDRATGFGRVTFRIREGVKVRIKKIVFAGNEHVKSRKLRKEMKETRKWWIWSWLTGKGRLKDDKFEEDLDLLRDHYRELGYLDVEIPRSEIAFNHPSSGSLEIVIPIREGRRYKVGDITFSGNKLLPSILLARVVQQRKGAWFAPEKLDKDVESIEEFYGRGGYLETRVRLLRKPNISTGDIDIEYQVEESERFYVESINIEGNTKTKSTVILRELSLGPGQVFDSLRMKISKLRLENTRFFEDGSVNVTPEVTNIPGRRNLKVALKEGRTGNLTFGAGFSSLESAVVFAEISQSNFDLFNYRSFFQGDGQKFRLRFQIGSQSSEAVLYFEEPWLFERELAFGFQLYHTTSDFNSAFYEELRAGGEVFLRKRLFELFEGRLSYRYEIVDIRNVDPLAPDIIRSIAGETTVSKVGFTLLRDTRDKIINTTRGNRLEAIFELAGGPFGADTNYYKIELRAAQFFPVYDFQNQVISVLLRGGVIQNYGDSDNVPFYDKFFLGGPTTLRGFEFRDVSPKDPFGEPIGGKSYGFVSIEYSFDIVSPIRFAVFYDGGFVSRGAFDFAPGTWNDNFGFGLRLFVAGSPLSLDFGIPLTTDRVNDKGGQFNFSFGTRF
ncbi:MAG TPA: outer membrane protein assembly factor BamA [Opitutaceae bacterium]